MAFSTRRFRLATICVALAATACGSAGQGAETIPTHRDPSESITQPPELTSSDSQSPEGELAIQTTAIPSPTPEPKRLASCPRAVAEDTYQLDAFTIEETTLSFEEAPISEARGSVYESDQGFAMVTPDVGLGPPMVVAISEDGLTWETYNIYEELPPDEAGVDLSQPSYSDFTSSDFRGFGGFVKQVQGEDGGEYLCLPASDGEGVILQPLPFAFDTEYTAPKLVGVVDGVIVLIVGRIEQADLIYNLDDVTLVMKAAPDGVIFVDQDSGAEVEASLDDEGASFIYVESGEVIASVSDEEFMELLESSVLIRDATGAPTVYDLAWSNDRGSSWNVVELPGQSPETSTRVTDAIVTQDGTVLMILDESSLGRLFDPDEITGQLTEEEFDQRADERIDDLGENDFWMRILRTKLEADS